MNTDSKSRRKELLLALTIMACVASLSSDRNARAEELGEALTDNAIHHGRLQLAAMFADRPIMEFICPAVNGEARFLKPDDSICRWAVRKFAGEDLGIRVFWSDDDPPAGAQSSYQMPSTTWRASIQIGKEIEDESGESIELPFEVLWYHAVFELHNFANLPRVEKLFESVSNGSLSKKRFIRECAKLEFGALKKTREFYERMWKPWAKENGLLLSPNGDWGLDEDQEFEMWFSGFTDDKSYPWKPYGAYFDLHAR